MIEGACFCGTVRYQASGPCDSMMSCHCSMCRKHHGAAFATYVSTALDGFRWVEGESALLSYRSSAQGVRNSCSVCGSTVPMALQAQAMALLPAGPLEGELGIRPQAHLFVGSKAPWYTITDDLPQHAEFPPEFAMPGVERPGVETRPGVTAGSCLCGAVAYEATGEPLSMQNCHCLRCRRARAAAHATNLFYRESQFAWLRGAEQVGQYKLPEARFHTTAFCRQCGSGVPRISAERGIVVIPAGGLDTDPSLRPQRHIFTNYKASWFQITDSLPQFAEAPPTV
ncbi:MAG TPA: GFA family protein [Steroidobacteraceae bacterium]|nr:GFA family protein [Steroidobacteraceae bacterium]